MEPDLAARLDIEPYAPLRARHAVEAVGHPPPDLRDVIVLLVSELVTNSIRHANLAAHQHIELRAWVRPDFVRVEVEDPGPGFEPDHQQSGYGFYLVDSHASSWGVEHLDGMTQVWFELTP
jgi:anti-sigma regulatory factor (Ser/Thr protein kinase)